MQMLSKVDKQTAQAFMQLNMNSDWEVVEKWLLENQEKIVSVLINETDPVIINQLQGGLQVIRDFLNKKNEAPVIYKKIK